MTLDSTIKELTEPKRPMTESEHRKAMGQFWTIRRDRVEKCNHIFYGEDPPKNNCPWCWFAFFQVNGKTTQVADECFQKEGRETLTKLKGEKFVKNFLRFMTTLAYMKENKINGFNNNNI